MTLPRLHVAGNNLLDPDDNVVRLKGVNFTPEAWLREEKGTEEQIKYMKNWGCNAVGIGVRGWVNWSDSKVQTKLDNLIRWAEKYNIYVILNGWNATGGSSPPWSHDMSVWTDDNWNNWISRWESYAKRFQGKTNLLFDLISEPLQVKSYALYQAKNRACIDAIRAIDPEIVIMVQAMSLDDQSSNLTFEFEQKYPVNRSNVVFCGHLYQGTWCEPEQGYTKDYFRSRMAYRKWDWIVNNDRCLWVGEFNTEIAFIEDPNLRGGMWLRNFLEVCNALPTMGFAAYKWTPNHEGRHCLLKNWNGDASASGAIIMEYLVAY